MIRNVFAGALVAASSAWSSPTAGQADAASACASGSVQPAVRATIRGFRDGTGTLRVYLYPNDEAAFTEPRRWLQRIVLPIRSRAPVSVCLPAPAPGLYAVSIGHDTNDNRRRDMDDGLGYSRNPRLSATRLKPRLRDVVVAVDQGPRDVEVVMNYRFGLSVRPVR